MIKKIIALGIIITGFISFSNAGITQPISHDSYNSNINSNYKITFLKGGAFLTNYLGQGRSILALRNNVLVRRTENGFPYFYLQSSSTPYFGLEQGFPDRYFLCEEITDGQTTTPGNCTVSDTRDYSGDNNTVKNDLQAFFKKVNLNDLVYYEFIDANREVYMHLCRNSSEIGNSLCFKVGKDNGYISGNVVYNKSTPLINSQNLIDLTFGLVNNERIGYAPGQPQYDYNGFIPGDGDTFGSGNTETIPSDVENYIKYYEDLYGRKESMCYVGVGDSYLDVPYGSGGISFAEGSGATIFGLYYHLYNTFGNNIIYNVGSFINAWTNNLYNTYKSDPYYIQYNGPGDNITVIYTGSFPFLNQPVAIYFMADNLNSYDNTENNGQGVVVYCDIKLNKDNYENGSLDFSRIEEIIPDYIKNNVKNYTNTSISGKDGYSTPDLGSGSIWGNLVQSGYNIPKDLNPTELFSDFYGKINGLITNFNPATRDGIIPLWIIYPMLFLILFRIMRH